MAKLTGALMSLSASGTIAKTLTYGSWKGIQYARTRVIPANPRSTSQTSTRDVFTYLHDIYRSMPTIGREPWIAAVIGQPMTPWNMIIAKNLNNLRSQVNLDDLMLSPGALGGIPPTAITVTPGAAQLTVDVTAPSAPSGWTITSAQAIAVRDQDPHSPIVSAPIAAEDLTSTYSVVLTSLAATSLYQVGAWLKWMTATGNAAYSIALRDQATTT